MFPNLMFYCCCDFRKNVKTNMWSCDPIKYRQKHTKLYICSNRGDITVIKSLRNVNDEILNYIFRTGIHVNHKKLGFSFFILQLQSAIFPGLRH